MVGYMNEEAFRRTVETGFATFYSRSRQKLWLKGESSGHRLAVKEIFADCDFDVVLRKASPPWRTGPDTPAAVPGTGDPCGLSGVIGRPEPLS